MILWTLSSSEVIKGIINKSYKQSRHEDDLNQPLSVQPWGSDSDKRRYYLIEGLDDTAFRVYRESNPQGFSRTWWSIAGTIEELNALVDKLQTVDGGPKARKLSQKVLAAVPRFEATEEKRRRREYRQMQKERFKRPEPGFSMYEGRTRGKRIKYTYSDDEDFLTDSSNRRSARNTGTHTPAEPAGPVTTASGRQIKAPSRMTVDASNNIVTTSPDGDAETVRSKSKESSVGPTGRPRRSAAVNHGTNGWSAAAAASKTRSRSYNSVDDDEDDEDESEPDLGDDEEEDHVPEESEDDEDEDEDEEDAGEDDLNEDEEMADEDLDDDDDDDDDSSPKSHIVTMKLPTKRAAAEAGKRHPGPNLDGYRYNGSSEPRRQRRRQQRPTGSAAREEEDDAPEERSEESIAVATTGSRATPEPPEANGGPAGDSPDHHHRHHRQPQRVPVTPAPLPSTSLAFRKSPDKMQQGLAPPPPPPQQQPVDVGR